MDVDIYRHPPTQTVTQTNLNTRRHVTSIYRRSRILQSIASRLMDVTHRVSLFTTLDEHELSSLFKVVVSVHGWVV